MEQRRIRKRKKKTERENTTLFISIWIESVFVQSISISVSSFLIYLSAVQYTQITWIQFILRFPLDDIFFSSHFRCNASIFLFSYSFIRRHELRGLVGLSPLVEIAFFLVQSIVEHSKCGCICIYSLCIWNGQKENRKTIGATVYIFSISAMDTILSPNLQHATAFKRNYFPPSKTTTTKRDQFGNAVPKLVRPR